MNTALVKSGLTHLKFEKENLLGLPKVFIRVQSFPGNKSCENQIYERTESHITFPGIISMFIKDFALCCFFVVFLFFSKFVKCLFQEHPV